MYDYEAEKRKWEESEGPGKAAQKLDSGEIEGSEPAQKRIRETCLGEIDDLPGVDNRYVPGFASV